MNKLFKKTLALGSAFLFAACFCFCSKVFAITKVLKITFVGDFNAGKTALRCTLTGEEFNFEVRNPTRTPDCLIKPIYYDSKTDLLCELWDTSGNANVKQQILDSRIQGSHFVVIVIDLEANVSNPRFDNIIVQTIEEWYKLIREKSPLSHVILVGTKIDAISPEQRERMAIRLEGANTFYDHFSYILTSAVTGEGIGTFFDIIKRKVNVSSLTSTKYVAVGALDDADFKRKSCVKCKKMFPADNGYRIESSGGFDYCSECAKAEEKARADAEMARLRSERETEAARLAHLRKEKEAADAEIARLQAAEEARKKYCDHKTCRRKFLPETGVKGKFGEYCCESHQRETEPFCNRGDCSDRYKLGSGIIGEKGVYCTNYCKDKAEGGCSVI